MKGGHQELALELIAAGADIDFRTTENDWTLLEYAQIFNQEEVANAIKARRPGRQGLVPIRLLQDFWRRSRAFFSRRSQSS